MAGVWRGHAAGCPCVRAPANDYEYYERVLRAALEARVACRGDAAGCEARALALLGPHVDAGCVAMPEVRADYVARLEELARCCQQQRLVVTELRGSSGSSLGDGEETPATTSLAAVRLSLLRGEACGDFAVFFNA